MVIPLDLTQLFCPGFRLSACPPSCFTTDIVGCWGEPCGEPAISLHSNTVPLVQWSTRLLPVMRDPGSIPRGYLCETGILLLGLSHYNIFKFKPWRINTILGFCAQNFFHWKPETEIEIPELYNINSDTLNTKTHGPSPDSSPPAALSTTFS